MDNLEVLKHSFDPDIMVMTHRKQAMQEQQMEYLRNLQATYAYQEFPIDAYASPPADKDSGNFLFEKGNDTFGNGNTFDVISGIRKNRPNSSPGRMAPNESASNRRSSAPGFETKIESRYGTKHW